MLVEQILEEGIDASPLDLAGAEALYQRANLHFRSAQTSPTGPGRASSPCRPEIHRPGRSGSS